MTEVFVFVLFICAKFGNIPLIFAIAGRLSLATAASGTAVWCQWKHEAQLPSFHDGYKAKQGIDISTMIFSFIDSLQMGTEGF